MKPTINLLLICIILVILSTQAWAASVGPNNYACWTAPTTNMDGTPLTDLGGYKVYWGTASRAYSGGKDVDLTAVAGGKCPTGSIGVRLSALGLSGGSLYMAVTAYDTAGNESGFSNEINFIFDALAPSAPSGFGIF